MTKYKSKIIEEVESILKDIKANGFNVNGTKELVNKQLNFKVSDLNMSAELASVKDYYDKYVGSFAERAELERTHYNRLRADITHELTRVQYFTNHDMIYGMNKLIDNVKEKSDKLDLLYEEKAKIEKELNKLSNFSGRRNVIFSQDCISFIQFLFRENCNTMTVVIRSSDAFNLLAIDLLSVIDIFNETINKFNIKHTKKDNVMFIISSCHTYNAEENKINKFLERENKSIL